MQVLSPSVSQYCQMYPSIYMPRSSLETVGSFILINLKLTQWFWKRIFHRKSLKPEISRCFVWFYYLCSVTTSCYGVDLKVCLIIHTLDFITHYLQILPQMLSQLQTLIIAPYMPTFQNLDWGFSAQRHFAELRFTTFCRDT